MLLDIFANVLCAGTCYQNHRFLAPFYRRVSVKPIDNMTPTLFVGFVITAAFLLAGRPDLVLPPIDFLFPVLTISAHVFLTAFLVDDLQNASRNTSHHMN